MNLTVESLTLSNLSEKKIATLRKPSSTRPSLYRIEEGEYPGGRQGLQGQPLGVQESHRSLLNLERKEGLPKAKGTEGRPALYGVVGGLALVLEEIRGRSIEELEKKEKTSGRVL